MHKRFTRSTLLAISFILLLLISVYVGLFLYIKHMQTLTADLNEKVEFEEQSRSQETALKLLAKNIKPDLATLSTFVVSSENEGDITFIKSLETLGAQQSVALRIVSAAEIDQDIFKTVTFQVTIEGGWLQVLRTIDLIESLPYKISQKQLTMNLIDNPGKKMGRQWRAALVFTVVKEGKTEAK